MTLRAFVAAAIVAASSGIASAQAPIMSADDLKAPSTPAVALLGTSPTTIERPDSPRALVFNLATSVSDAGGVPQNYAAQVAPYWMRSHPDLLFHSYISPSIGESAVRSLAVSIATADWRIGSGSKAADLGSRLGVGISSVVLPGRVDAALPELVSELTRIDEQLEMAARARDDEPRLRALSTRQQELTARLRDERDAARLVDLSRQLADAKMTIAAITADADAQIARLERAAREATLKIQALNVQRVGMQLAIAGAASWRIPDDVFGDTTGERAAFWATPSYRSCVAACGKDDDSKARSYLDAIGVLRYVRDRVAAANGLDVGGRVVWEITSAFAVSGESVGRWWSAASPSDNSLRAVAVFEAKLADKAFLFASFGRDFTDAEKDRTLVSVVGLNIGFGEKPVLPLVTR